MREQDRSPCLCKHRYKSSSRLILRLPGNGDGALHVLRVGLGDESDDISSAVVWRQKGEGVLLSGLEVCVDAKVRPIVQDLVHCFCSVAVVDPCHAILCCCCCCCCWQWWQRHKKKNNNQRIKMQWSLVVRMMAIPCTLFVLFKDQHNVCACVNVGERKTKRLLRMSISTSNPEGSAF